MKKGVILNNIGSPDGPDTKSVKIYLREFLMDPGVIAIPYIFRFILVYFIISIFRAPKSAAKYQKIWRPEGSPLVSLTQSLARKIMAVSNQLAVETGMLFQNPSISAALKNLSQNNPDLEAIYFVPMYPQYSAATTEAGLTKFKSIWNKHKKMTYKDNQKTPTVYFLKPFYDSDFFIDNYVKKVLEFNLSDYDVLLFSYHGLPKSAILGNPHCQLDNKCCETGMKKNCYRSQCFATTRAISKKLNSSIRIETTFQSRLGPSEWIQPYTDETLVQLAKSGVKKILVVCPAFTVDCLETLEEIQIENKKLFLESGGIKFDYVTCLNDDDSWSKDLAKVLESDSYFDRL